MEETRISPNQKWALEWRELVKERELLFFFVWRNFKIRYKQTLIGASWAILRPAILMVVFTLTFNRVASVDSGSSDVPYPIFAYAGLMFWSYFQQSTSQIGESLVQYQGVINKIYFPRLMVPLSTAITGLIDFFLGLIIYIFLMFYYSISPEPIGLLLFLPMLLLTFITTIGIGVFMASLNVKYRDVRQALPFFIQLLLFLTPVVYPVELVPQNIRWLLFLNPMAGVVDTMQAGLLGLREVQWGYLLISTASAIFLLIFGLWFFRAREREMADIV